ncbi:hypothetical protein [Fluviispira multicolorata]|uniref:Uncharacterized protein n=1 Tax=Fluviispira multicolorata TaxID=2654512 RepID=A0A833JHR0_9BACT|nr:hypothetical protein [Fluviispira multicolorata]KAB8033597.1 hypothetical protein GCL57_02500 [Fluviispira multicolorata]
MEKLINLVNIDNNNLLYPFILFAFILFFIERLIKIKADNFIRYIINSVIYNFIENTNNTKRNLFIINYLKKLKIFSSRISVFYTNGFYNLLLKLTNDNKNLIYCLNSDNKIDSKLLISSAIIDCLEHKNRNYNKIFNQCALIDIDHNEITFQMTTEEIINIFQAKYKKCIMKSCINKDILPKSIILFYREKFINEIKHKRISKAVKKFILEIKSNIDHDAVIILLDYIFDIEQENIYIIETNEFLIKNNDLKLTQNIHFKGIDLNSYNFLKNMSKYDSKLFILESMNNFWKKKYSSLYKLIYSINISFKNKFRSHSSTPFKKHYSNNIFCNIFYTFLILFSCSLITFLLKNIINYNIYFYKFYIICLLIMLMCISFYFIIKSFSYGIEKINANILTNWKPKLFEINSNYITLIISNFYLVTILLITYVINFGILNYVDSGKGEINNNNISHNYMSYMYLIIIIFIALLFRTIYNVYLKRRIHELIFKSSNPIEIVFASKSIYELQKWISINPQYFLSEDKYKNEIIKILQEWAFGYVSNYPYKWKRRDNTPYSGSAWDLIYEIERYCSIKYERNLVQGNNTVKA